MKEKDLVIAFHAQDLQPRVGIVVKIHKSPGPFGMAMYDVLTVKGVETYTSAALRGINESR